MRMTADNANDFAYEPIVRTLSPGVKRAYWDVAMGLQAVDGLRPSDYLRVLAEEHVEEVRSLEETGALLRLHYQQRGQHDDGETLGEAERTLLAEREADFVSHRIVELLSDQAFALAPGVLSLIHRRLFADLDEGTYRPGQFKDVALQKSEFILNGDSVVYADPSMIEASLRFAFEEEAEYCYDFDFDEGQIDHFSRFVARVWQVYPFFEGNTRAVAVLAILYLREMGFDIDSAPFAESAEYFRNALVRANYRNAKARVMPNRAFLNVFFDNVINGTDHELRSRNLVVSELFDDPNLLRNVDPSRAIIRS